MFMRCITCNWFGTEFDPNRCNHRGSIRRLYGAPTRAEALATLRRQARPAPKANVQVVMRARPGAPL